MSRSLAALLFVILALAVNARDRQPLSALEASRFAADIANAHCEWRFGCRPFDASAGDLTIRQGRWHWRATAAHGQSDLVTEVTFSETGETPTVRIDVVDSPEVMRRATSNQAMQPTASRVYV